MGTRTYNSLNKEAILFVLLLLLLLGKGYAGACFILGAEDQAGPWGQNDGTGCGNDIVRAAFAASGDSVELHILPYVRAKKMTVTGELAGCFAMAWDPDLKGNVVLSETPLYQVTVILLARHGEPAHIHSLDDLPLHSILGLVKDYEYPPEVRAIAQKRIKIEEVASESQNLKKLAAGRITATVVCCDPLKSLLFLLKQAGVEDKIDSISVIGVQKSCVGFSLRHPSGLPAKQHFEEGIAIILKNGTYESIVQDWARKSLHAIKEGVK